METYTWLDGSYGQIELTLDVETILACSHQGSCDADVDAALRNVPGLREQFEKQDLELMRSYIEESGAWEREETEDPEHVYQILLWMACGELVEEHKLRNP